MGKALDSGEKAAIVCAALEARKGGKTWAAALGAAKRAGFSGSLTTLKRWTEESKTNPMPGSRVDARTTMGRLDAGTSKGKGEGVITGGSHWQQTAAASGTRQAERQNLKLTQAASWEQIENRFPVLRDGTKYERPVSLFDGPFFTPASGELLAWSYIVAKQEALCVENSHASDPRGADVLVDNTINPSGSALTVVMNSAHGGAHPVGSRVEVRRRWDGTAFVAIRDVVPGQKLVLVNKA